MSQKKVYTQEYKVNAVMLAGKIGKAKAARELCLPENTLYSWILNARQGRLELPPEARDPKTSIAIAERLKALEAENHNLKVENRRLAEEKEILEKATRFFANVQKKY